MTSIDFVGSKYLEDSDNRINFLSCKYIRPEKHGTARRIEGQTTEETKIAVYYEGIHSKILGQRVRKCVI